MREFNVWSQMEITREVCTGDQLLKGEFMCELMKIDEWWWWTKVVGYGEQALMESNQERKKDDGRDENMRRDKRNQRNT